MRDLEAITVYKVPVNQDCQYVGTYVLTQVPSEDILKAQIRKSFLDIGIKAQIITIYIEPYKDTFEVKIAVSFRNDKDISILTKIDNIEKAVAKVPNVVGLIMKTSNLDFV